MAPGNRGDEDEGSLPRGRANREARARENREISGCPPGVPPPDPFPLMDPDANAVPATVRTMQRGVASKHRSDACWR
jgi:hypothetical protein